MGIKIGNLALDGKHLPSSFALALGLRLEPIPICKELCVVRTYVHGEDRCGVSDLLVAMREGGRGRERDRERERERKRAAAATTTMTHATHLLLLQRDLAKLPLELIHGLVGPFRGRRCKRRGGSPTLLASIVTPPVVGGKGSRDAESSTSLVEVVRYL